MIPTSDPGLGFDPTYGYTLADLLAVAPPAEPSGFIAFWRDRYDKASRIDPRPERRAWAQRDARFRIEELAYRSTDDFRIGGWLLSPFERAPVCGFVLGHGYGGISEPPLDLPRDDAAYLIPCFRGIGLSRRHPISDDPRWHVLHDIDKPDRYILGGCVEDVWTGVGALLSIFPHLEGHLGYLGISFGGGIGALALPWEPRVQRGHLNVPTFGHHPLRLRLPTLGSAAAVQAFARRHRHVVETLAYYDAAIAARHLRQPMHVAAALMDPAVAPPGQFAIYNAIPGEKHLFVLDAGHLDYPAQEHQAALLMTELRGFFAEL